MKNFLITVIILFSITTTIAFASANIAPQAKTLRKTYDNGNYSEVECENRVNSKGRFPCVFRTNEGNDLTTYSFDLYDYGYDHNSVTEEYTYWPSGHVVSFSVYCIDSDIQLLKKNDGLELTDMDIDFVECRIFLYPFDRTLLAKRVEIRYYENGKYYGADRKIEDSNSKP
jgi:hypothetical protein